MRNLFFNFGISDTTGWGNYGYHLTIQSFIQKLFMPVSLGNIHFAMQLDPISHAIFKELSEGYWKGGVVQNEGDIVLHGLGNTGNVFKRSTKVVKEIGVTFFEMHPLPAPELKTYKEFELVVAGSTWNLEKLCEYGVENTALVFQGVDEDRFRPMSKRRFRDRFVVFSGGKLEFRKGQDLLVKAFAAFAAKHSDALLVSAWHSPWGQVGASVNWSGGLAPFAYEGNLHSAIKQWVLSNGIAENQFIDLGSIPNQHFPEVLREVDVAVFPNRCEGGTNLVAMEALSSDVLCIISNNTGHRDLVKGDNCLSLEKQRPVQINDPTFAQAWGSGVDWGESDVDEILFNLEMAYTNPGIIQAGCARQSVAEYSWAQAIKQLSQHIDAICDDQ